MTREMSSAEGLGGQVPGAVVIGGDYQGLGILRSLGRLGVPVCVIDDERSISRYSRFAARSVRAKGLYIEENVVETLLDAGRRYGLDGAVLFPTRDEIVAAISRNRDELATVYRVPTPPWEAIRWAWDKRNTYELAAELSIPAPRTAWPADEDELDALELDFPVVVKPAVKEHFMTVTRAKAWRADSREELTSLYRKACAIIPAGEAMVQELIRGGGERQYAYCAFFKDGEAVTSMKVRRRRQHPWEFGRASTFVETVDETELEQFAELEENSLRFLRRIGYYGLVELEYKQDARDGSFKLLDVNARTWGYHTLGAAAGVDFSAALYHDQIGVEVERRKARAGVTWLRLVTDIPTGLSDIAARRVGLLAYLRSIRSVDIHAVWDRDDLRPLIAEIALLPYLMAKRGF